MFYLIFLILFISAFVMHVISAKLETYSDTMAFVAGMLYLGVIIFFATRGILA